MKEKNVIDTVGIEEINAPLIKIIFEIFLA